MNDETRAERNAWMSVLGAVARGLGSTSRSGAPNALRRIDEIATARLREIAPAIPSREDH